jgi:hypothetical protein
MLALGSSSKLEKQTYHKVQQNYLIFNNYWGWAQYELLSSPKFDDEYINMIDDKNNDELENNESFECGSRVIISTYNVSSTCPSSHDQY